MNRMVDLRNNPLYTKEEALAIMNKIIENNSPDLFYINYGNYMDNYPVLWVNYPKFIILFVKEPNAKEIAEELWNKGCSTCKADGKENNQDYVFIAMKA